jgi:hypothetical protein
MDQRDAGEARQPESDRHPDRSSDVTVASPVLPVVGQAADPPPWAWPTEASYPATSGPPGIPVPASAADASYWPAQEPYGAATAAPPEQETATTWDAPGQQQLTTPERYDPPSAQDADAAWAGYWAAQEQNADPAPGAYESAAPPSVPLVPPERSAGSRGNAPIVLFIIAAAVLGGAILALAGYLLFGRSSTPGATPTAGAVAAPPTAPTTVAPTAAVVATATRAATAASAPSASAATVPVTAPLAVPTQVPGSATPAVPLATPITLPPTALAASPTPLAIPVVLPPTAEPTLDLPPEPTQAPLPPAPVPAPVFIPPAPVVNNPPPQPTPVPTVVPAPPTAPAPTKPPPPVSTTPPQQAATKPPTSGARPVPTVPPGFIPPYAPRPITTPIGG